jgi:hypothetical protein
MPFFKPCAPNCMQTMDKRKKAGSPSERWVVWGVVPALRKAGRANPFWVAGSFSTTNRAASIEAKEYPVECVVLSFLDLDPVRRSAGARRRLHGRRHRW